MSDRRRQTSIATVGAREDAGAFGFTLASGALGFLLRGCADDGSVAFIFSADPASDLLTLGPHALVHALLRFRREISLADANVDDTHAEFGGGGGVQTVFDLLHEFGAAPRDDVVRAGAAEGATHRSLSESFEPRDAASFVEHA